MEMNLNNIIEKIKDEGVAEAEQKAAGIIKQAEAQAKQTIENSKKEKENIIKKAEEQAASLKQNGEEAMRQASRDVILGLRGEIETLFDSVLKQEVSSQLSPEVIADMVSSLVDKFQIDGGETEVLVSGEDKEKVEKFLLAKLNEKVKKGTTLKVSPSIEKGFRIGEKGKNSYYDFTDESIAETFKTFLNPKMIDILNK